MHPGAHRLGGRPLAQAFAFGYLVYPFPDLSLMAETNDALIAALCVWTIVAAGHPAARGLLMAAAALTKFLPVLLALQFLATRRGRSRYAFTLVAALAAMLAWPVITCGPAAILDSTFGYQLLLRGGGVQFSIWTYLPRVAIVARPLLAAMLVLLALSTPRCAGPRYAGPGCARRLGRPPARGAGRALLIGGQLVLGYWFYSYLTWCYPLIVVAVMAARPGRGAAGRSASVAAEDDPRGRGSAAAAAQLAGVADRDLLEADTVVVGGARDV